MALESAVNLDRKLFARQHPDPASIDRACAEYFALMRDWRDSWSSLINYFYDGRMLAMGQMRDHIRASASLFSISRYAEPLVSRTLSQLVSGVGTRSRFNQSVLHHTTQHLIQDKSCLKNNQISSALGDGQISAIDLTRDVTPINDQDTSNQGLKSA